MTIPTLKTERLLLRPLTAEDTKAVFVWVSDPRVTKYMPYTTYTNSEDVKQWLLSLQGAEGDYNFGFVVKENNLLVGSGDIGYDKSKNAWGFGYNFRYDYWNRGYATEAAKGMIEFAYRELGARDFCASHAIGNIGSQRVIEKCGLQFHSFGEYSKFDGSDTFPCINYKAHIEYLPHKSNSRTECPHPHPL